MKPGVLWKLSVVTCEGAEEAVAELLTARLGQPTSSYTDLKMGRTTVSVYLQRKPLWSAGFQKDFETALQRIKGERFSKVYSNIKLAKLPTEDWAESWKRHFQPMEIERRLLIKPSWSSRRSRKGQVTVELDPGMSFGTGQHPTTRFCLQELVHCQKAAQKQSFLDVGTGSGILAICAAKLGYSPVVAVEVDRGAVQIARSNARLNQVAKRIELSCRDVADVASYAGRQYSVVCANLTANLLLAEAKRLFGVVATGGLLVLAGILRSEFTGVQAVYERLGLQLVSSRTEKEWRSGSFLK
jgi:ribosomal protein L11 methyltransferase